MDLFGATPQKSLVKSTFKVYHHPVRMEDQMALKAEVDEITFFLTADSMRLSKEGNIRCVIHCYNGITLSSGLLKTASSFYEVMPKHQTIKKKWKRSQL